MCDKNSSSNNNHYSFKSWLWRKICEHNIKRNAQKQRSFTHIFPVITATVKSWNVVYVSINSLSYETWHMVIGEHILYRKPCLKRPLKNRKKTKVFKTNGSLMKVESIE